MLALAGLGERDVAIAAFLRPPVGVLGRVGEGHSVAESLGKIGVGHV